MTDDSPRTAPWLGRLCLWFACGLLAAWATYRVKPVLWYGPLFGGVCGGVAAALRVWFPTSLRWINLVEVALLAMLGVAGSLWVSAERARAATTKTSNDAIADTLIGQLEKMPVDGQAAPPVPGSVPAPGTLSVGDRWQQLCARRYRGWTALEPWGWAITEFIAAGIVAGAVSQLASAVTLLRQPEASQEPGA